MLNTGINLAYYSLLLLPLFRAVFSQVTYTQKYKILDPSGQESSFFYDGGQFEITCDSSDNSSKLEIVNIDNPSKPLKEGNGKVSHSIDLKPSLIGEYFQCAPLRLFPGRFGIRNFQCDPFSLLPKAENCKDSQVCLINADKKAECKELTDDLCFPAINFAAMKKTFSSSLPTLRYACKKDASDNEEQSHGFCHARVMHVAQITGISYSDAQCKFFRETLFNGKNVLHDDYVVELNDIASWNVTFVTDSDDFKIACDIINSNQMKLAEIPVTQSKKTIKFANAKILQYKKPIKLRLTCAFHSTKRIIKSISFYVLVIDTASVALKVTPTSTVEKPGESVSIGCSCSVSSGFFCSLSWKKIAITSVSQAKGALKKLIQKKDHSQQTGPYECFASTYVVGFPSTYKLLELQGIDKTVSIKLGKQDFEQPSGTDVGKHVIRSNDTDSSNSSKSNVKKPGENESSSMSKGIVALIICFVLLLFIGLIVAVVFWKRFRNRKAEAIASDAKLHQPAESDDKKDIENHPAILPNVKLSSTVKNEKIGPKIVTKSPTSKKSSQPSQDINFIEMCKSDTKHHTSAAMLIEFRANMNNIVNTANAENENAKDGFVNVMINSNDPIQKNIAEEIIETKTVRPKAKYLATVRWPDVAIAEDHFPFKGNPDVILHDSIPKQDLQAPVNALGMTSATDNKGKKRFLLSQAPMRTEMPTFLEAVMTMNVALIVTLLPNSDLEDTGTKINKQLNYYRKDTGASEAFGVFKITCVQKIVNDTTYETRRFILKNLETKISRIFDVLSYLSWQDKSTLKDPGHLLTLRGAIKNLQSSHGPASTTLIHCSAGLGRTGVLVAAINAIDYMEDCGTEFVNVFRIVEKLRNERIGAIQTGNQSCLLYWSLGEYLNQKLVDAAPKLTKNATGTSKRSAANSIIKGTK